MLEVTFQKRLPGFALDVTEKRLIVELRRQAIHVIPRQSDAGADASSPLSVPLTPGSGMLCP